VRKRLSWCEAIAVLHSSVAHQSLRVRVDAAQTWLSIVNTRACCLKSKQSGVVNGGARMP
jgi:hypothetical protein